jgi:hypothetical protein
MDEVWAGDSLLAFDGRVLEVFGFPGSQSVRFHVRNMELDVGGPNRRGMRLVTLKAAVRGAGGLAFSVEEADWPYVGPMLDRVLAAMRG